MKNLLAILILTISSSAFAGGEIKQVCSDATDKKGNVIKNKDGSVKQICKNIKVHKKVEGTVVPKK
mgnify:CR=1 FL=1